ncbi:hypothetical protein [Amycolatopsis sp. NPDC058986]|uniref:hypothetical protein n=1 Tax=unclassified Amycolatopsis TaxID=2618356 RepID=UPI00366B51BA
MTGELDDEWAVLHDQSSWEIGVRVATGRTPFGTLTDFALGLALWTARKDSAAEHEHSDEPVALTVPRIVVCLVALAAYDVARERGLDEPELAPLDVTAARLVEDASARRIAAIEPGCVQEPGGRLREDDRGELTAALRPDARERWQAWREQAWHILDSHATDAVVPYSSLRSRLHLVRWMYVRRDWYAHPDVSPVLPLEASFDDSYDEMP